jgi:3-methylcrotonyl-CoA carboxylase alpha subunit
MPASVNKILIANRGEIAMRIIRTTRKLGIPTVGIYTGVDAGSPWIKSATEAYSLGDGDISETYLNIDKILGIAGKCGADAIHPGYGFLSENHLFARACHEHNINFIGPSAEVLELMGDKIAAHRLAEDLGLAVPDRIIGSPHEILAMGSKLDYPVLVKAVAGGGGKGMRLVQRAGELTSVLNTASNEALNYFGDDRIYLEKYLLSPRHIEVQILGDKHGNLVHLFERECSIQRRHQKIIEEAPAACLSDAIREKMFQAALTLGRAVNYYGAGTVEFLLDDRGNFYFLEMNPRIQVEHGITELITGIDIIKEQIAVAAGFPLSVSSNSLRKSGHAMEARIFAEDPENNLLPSPGKIVYYHEPDLPDVRIDSSVASGSVIAADYDPLIAKVMVHASARETAVRKLKRALGEFVIAGPQHNNLLLQAILSERDFLRNEVSTTYLHEKMPALLEIIARHRRDSGMFPPVAAAALSVLWGKTTEVSASPWQLQDHWRMVPRIRFRINGDPVEIDYYHSGPDAMDFYHEEKLYPITGIQKDNCRISFTLNAVRHHFYPLPEQEAVLEFSDGVLNYRIERFRRPNLNGKPANQDGNHAGDRILRAPMPGKVTRLQVTVSSWVESGDPLITMESMKLENTLLAPCPGLVQEIYIREGEFVQKNDKLLEIIVPGPSINSHNPE